MRHLVLFEQTGNLFPQDGIELSSVQVLVACNAL